MIQSICGLMNIIVILKEHQDDVIIRIINEKFLKKTKKLSIKDINMILYLKMNLFIYERVNNYLLFFCKKIRIVNKYKFTNILYDKIYI